MKNEFFQNKKAVFTSIFMVGILVSVSTILPGINGAVLSNNTIDIKNKKGLVNENDIKNSLLIDHIQKRYGIQTSFIEDIFEYFGLFNLNRYELREVITDRILPLADEIEKLHLGKKTFQECSQDLQELCFIFERSNSNEDGNEEKISQVPADDEISQDFIDYSIPYRQLYAILYGDATENKILGNYNRVWLALYLFGSIFDEKNYYDWFMGILDKIDFLRGFTILIGFFCILVLMLAPFEGSLIIINIGAAIFILLLFWFNAHLASYVHNGHEYFQRCTEKEINILIHVIDNETKEGVPDYKISEIQAISTDAMNWIDQDGKDETKGRDKHYFQYILGKSDSMNNNAESGWYSLETRYIAEGYEDPLKKYIKAPCPPGNWEIHIDGNAHYLPYDNTDIYVKPGATIILNATLEPHN